MGTAWRIRGVGFGLTVACSRGCPHRRHDQRGHLERDLCSRRQSDEGHSLPGVTPTLRGVARPRLTGLVVLGVASVPVIGWLLAPTGTGRVGGLLGVRPEQGCLVGGGVVSGGEGADHEVGPLAERRRFGVDGAAELTMEFEEPLGWGELGEGAGDVEDVDQHPVTGRLVAGEGGCFGDVAAQRPVDCDGEQFGVAEGVADTVTGDRVAVIAGITDEAPTGTHRLADVVRQT
jgi:hypothetical protein